MGEQANLSQTEAVEKIRHIAKGEIAMLHSFDAFGRSSARPMGTSAIDDDGVIWFMSKAGSFKNQALETNPRAQLTYSVHSRSEYLTLDGEVTLLRDQPKIDAIWTVFAKTWFPGGKDDPSITLIRFTPTNGHYWDTKHSKMVQLAGMAFGALTGKETDDGVEGNVRL